MLEAKIEEKVCNYAKERGFLVYKFTSPNRAAVPDRLFVHPTGEVAFIEFKATGKKPTPAQEREHMRLRGHNINVYVVDDIEEGKAVIDRICAACLGC
jgi:hypothetical protein